MNNQERQVIDGIFERLKNVATQARDPEAEKYIGELVQKQPYATYALAQSVYVQEQALLNQQQQIEQMQAEIAELQSRPAPPAGGGGFLSGLFGGGQQQAPARPQGGMPAYGQRQAPPPPAAGPWGGQPAQAGPGGPWGGAQQGAQPRQGMGFLGTAAAAAAGVAGGMVLGSVLSNAFGGGQANAATPAQPQPAASDAQPQEQQDYDEASDTGGGWDDGGGDSYDV
ncbi:MAG: DUF2076 domain-containing protein [Rhabdaerophilum sp.]